MLPKSPWASVAALVAVGWLGLASSTVQAQRVFPGPLYPTQPSPVYRPTVPYYYPPPLALPPSAYNYPGLYNVNPVPPAVPDGSYSSGGGYDPGVSQGGGIGGYGGGYGMPIYYFDPWGGFLRGSADVMRAYGQVGFMMEQARLAREIAEQAKFETRKKLIDLINYERQNLPTFADDQKRIERLTLERIKTTATLNEIWTGKSSNFLLRDLAKHRGKRVAVEDISLPEEVLRNLNVTGASGNVGLLRNNGQLTWPPALMDTAFRGEREKIDKDAQKLYRQAFDAKPNNFLARDLQINIEKMRDDLFRKVGEVPPTQYLEAKRFLSDLDDAILGMRDGDAARNIEFQTFVKGGKTVQELAKYVIERGLTFAPAVAGDEPAYQALHSALVAHNIAVHAQKD